MPSPAAPLGQADRLVALDTLRGFALLGILAMNIQAYSMPDLAYLNPTAYGDFTGVNRAVWLVSRIFFDQKFMTIFSLLFGAGIVLFAAKAEAAGRRPAVLHYRRMFWLLLVGLAHAYGFWTGDILVTYALAAMILYPLRRRRARTLFLAGFFLLAFGSAIWIGLGWSMQFWPPEDLAAFSQENWQPSAADVQEELAAYRAGWLTQLRYRVPISLEWQVFGFVIWGFWRAGGLMLIGMALFKWDVITGSRSDGFYRRAAAAGLLVGLAFEIYGTARNFAVNWDVRYSFFFGFQWNYWASLFMSASYIATLLLIVNAGAFAGLTARLAAVGRMAFTNYLLQTLICTSLFYGHGLGLFGRVPRIGQVAIVVAIWILQLAVSPVWLRHFQFGPFEWAWRSLTYWQRQPFRRQLSAP